jgi:hypothetical protein
VGIKSTLCSRQGGEVDFLHVPHYSLGNIICDEDDNTSLYITFVAVDSYFTHVVVLHLGETNRIGSFSYLRRIPMRILISAERTFLVTSSCHVL